MVSCAQWAYCIYKHAHTLYTQAMHFTGSENMLFVYGLETEIDRWAFKARETLIWDQIRLVVEISGTVRNTDSQYVVRYTQPQLPECSFSTAGESVCQFWPSSNGLTSIYWFWIKGRPGKVVTHRFWLDLCNYKGKLTFKNYPLSIVAIHKVQLT